MEVIPAIILGIIHVELILHTICIATTTSIVPLCVDASITHGSCYTVPITVIYIQCSDNIKTLCST